MAKTRYWLVGRQGNLIAQYSQECSLYIDLENESGVKISNYHFTETYSNKEIHFDYHLLLGRSNTTNAKYLMEMVGIRF
ncbi:hypothetical protein [Methylomusa anaerophila]|uniref:hypothetical protein n=1 Tax=Methylomusa anaerophila TaxID=1930071 RepID=UPI002D1FA0F9|nr:hypothetical protein [Methylomusa anaerophila]